MPHKIDRSGRDATVPVVAPGTRELCSTRRSVLRGLAAVGVATITGGVLVACGSGDETTGSDNMVPASEVPVGEARVVDAGGERVVVAQPTEGEFVAFSARCTHQGATVNAEGGLDLVCPNHGSAFDAADGSVRNGPATEALPSVPVRLEGDKLVLG